MDYLHTDFGYKNHIKMIRKSTLNFIDPLVLEAIYELFVKCKENMLDDSDFLVCQQNGFIYDGKPALGIGDGLDWIQQLNAITCGGIGAYTDDDGYFDKVRNSVFDGTTEVEKTTNNELNCYRKIWENEFFLRCLTQLAHLLNGEHYDWTLDVNFETKGGRGKYAYITALIEKFKKAPKFYSLIKEVYNNKIRNSEAHTQCVFVQDGFLLKNIKEQDDQAGLLFEQWERIFVILYLILIYIRRFLNVIRSQYLEFYHEHGAKGVPTFVPFNGSWEKHLIFPNESGEIWRFVQ